MCWVGCVCAAGFVGASGSLAVNCTGLTELNLSGCLGICGPGLAAVGECCPKLVHLDISDCKQVRLERPGAGLQSNHQPVSNFSLPAETPDCLAHSSVRCVPQKGEQTFDIVVANGVGAFESRVDTYMV